MNKWMQGWAATLMLALLPGAAAAAEPQSLKAALSWSGHGKVFLIGVDKKEFLGVIEGVLYTESSEGEVDEAFMECSVKQLLDVKQAKTRAEGNCIIVQSGDDNVFASYTCNGGSGGCRGKLTLNSGTGRFKGISGSSPMIIRSPMQYLAEALTDAEELVVDHGVMLLPDLQYRLKGGKS